MTQRFCNVPLLFPHECFLLAFKQLRSKRNIVFGDYNTKTSYFSEVFGYYNCVTMLILLVQCWKRIHAVGVDN